MLLSCILCNMDTLSKETYLMSDTFLTLGYSCCAQDNNPIEESTNQSETDAAGDVPNTTRTEKQ